MDASVDANVVIEREGYSIDVKIRHPTWTASQLTGGMGTDPDVSFDVGERHRGAGSGTLLGVRRFTYWCVGHQVECRRNFFDEFESVCEWLGTKRTFLVEVQAGGGTVAVDIGLRGSANIGSSLGPVHLRMAADLGVTLGIEVFPTMSPVEVGERPASPWDRKLHTDRNTVTTETR